MSSKGIPNLVLRSGSYYFRIAIPRALQARFQRKEIKLSLRTADAGIGLLLWWFGGAGENHVSRQISDSLSQQYDIAARQGNRMDMCTHAGATALGFLQAKDENSYAHWKSVQKRDCAAAGIPIMD